MNDLYLTDRDLVALRMLARGLPQKQVADKMGVTRASLAWQLRCACRRNNKRNTLALAVAAVRGGWIE